MHDTNKQSGFWSDHTHCCYSLTLTSFQTASFLSTSSARDPRASGTSFISLWMSSHPWSGIHVCGLARDDFSREMLPWQLKERKVGAKTCQQLSFSKNTQEQMDEHKQMHTHTHTHTHTPCMVRAHTYPPPPHTHTHTLACTWSFYLQKGKSFNTLANYQTNSRCLPWQRSQVHRNSLFLPLQPTWLSFGTRRAVCGLQTNLADEKTDSWQQLREIRKKQHSLSFLCGAFTCIFASERQNDEKMGQRCYVSSKKKEEEYFTLKFWLVWERAKKCGRHSALSD